MYVNASSELLSTVNVMLVAVVSVKVVVADRVELAIANSKLVAVVNVNTEDEASVEFSRATWELAIATKVSVTTSTDDAFNTKRPFVMAGVA